MVTKEQRRGIRWDVNTLADLVRKKGAMLMGEIQVEFNWSATKTENIMKAVDETHEDIMRYSRQLVHVQDPTAPPSPDEDLVVVSDVDSYPRAKEIMERED